MDKYSVVLNTMNIVQTLLYDNSVWVFCYNLNLGSLFIVSGKKKNLGCLLGCEEGDVEYYEEEGGRKWRKGNIISCCWITLR